MPTIDIQVQRFSVVSQRPFDEVSSCKPVRSCSLPRNHGRRNGQRKVVLTGAQIVHLEPSDRVGSSPDDDSDLPPAWRRSRAVCNR
jgi:hypothetical protein